MLAETFNLSILRIMKFIKLLLVSLVFVACSVGPQPINYGEDACNYCDMTIVDKQHAAQLVSTKGKAFKYDAIECMVHSSQEDLAETEIALYLVANFDNPGELVDATLASYLVSDQIQSPMGANLSAFKKKDGAQKTKEKFSGKIYTWEEIQKHLKQ